MTSLPKDPIMLLSFINMKLRDFYSDLDMLCDDMDISRAEIENILNKAGYEYSKEQNRFK